MSPLNGDKRIEVDKPFNLVIFPALRKKKDFEALRAAWGKRIRYEEIARGFWAPGNREVENGDSLERQQFLTETQPDLVWQMEEDLFQAGDQKNAALRMLEHLRENIAHSNARDWESRFRALVDPEPQPDSAPGA